MKQGPLFLEKLVKLNWGSADLEKSYKFGAS